jgi:uncharacterized OB-fold protein
VSAPIPLAEGLFTWPADEPELIAGRVPGTDRVLFPRPEHVMADDGSLVETEEIRLPRRGNLWTFTTQRFRPPASKDSTTAFSEENFRPFTVGYIELPGFLKIQTRITEADPDRLRIGQEMELVMEPFGQDTQGRDVVTFAFSPVEEVS